MTDQTPLLTWSEVGRRVRAKGRGWPYRLAQALDMDSSHFYRMLKTEGELTERQARIVRNFLDDAPIEPTAFIRPPDRPRIPVYGYAVAGQPDREAYGGNKVIGDLDPPPWWSGNDTMIYVRMPGESMHPRYFAGQIVPVKLNLSPAHGQDCLIEFKDGSVMIRNYQGERDGQVWVQQFGQDPKTYGIPSTEVAAKHSVWLPGSF